MTSIVVISIKMECEDMGEKTSIDKLKTQVKGYSVKMITDGMLKKHKLGDALAEICDMNELEEDIRESNKIGLPVYGFFRGKKMWSCFLFEKIDIPKNELSPEPESGKDTLCIYRLRKAYVAPEVKELEDDMMEAAHSNLYQNAIDVFSDGKCDGIVWNDSIYVCKREKSTGLPIGIAIGVGLGIIYGMIFDNLALGIALGFCFGISFSMIFGTSTHKYVEHSMTENMDDNSADSDLQGAGVQEPDDVTDK